MSNLIGSKIHDKLITDFTALNYTASNPVFVNVKKYFAADTMAARDILVRPDFNSEETAGQSSGNTATTREYSYRAIMVEFINSSESDSEVSIKYSRLENQLDALLDYIQKEPSNLNSWGNTQSPVINIFKMRLKNVNHDVQLTENGYGEILDVRFSVYLNITPQLL